MSSLTCGFFMSSILCGSFLLALSLGVICMSSTLYSILYGYFCELYTVWSFLWALYCVVIFMSSKLCGSFMSSTVYCAFPKNLISFSLIVSRGLSPLFSRKLSCWNAWQRFHLWTNVWNLNSQKEPNNNNDMFPFRLWHFYSFSNSKLPKGTKQQRWYGALESS